MSVGRCLLFLVGRLFLVVIALVLVAGVLIAVVAGLVVIFGPVVARTVVDTTVVRI